MYVCSAITPAQQVPGVQIPASWKRVREGPLCVSPILTFTPFEDYFCFIVFPEKYLVKDLRP